MSKLFRKQNCKAASFVYPAKKTPKKLSQIPLQPKVSSLNDAQVQLKTLGAKLYHCLAWFCKDETEICTTLPEKPIIYPDVSELNYGNLVSNNRKGVTLKDAWWGVTPTEDKELRPELRIKLALSLKKGFFSIAHFFCSA